jgi:hypothetical protein
VVGKRRAYVLHGYTLVDVYTKFHCTRAYALTNCEFLWLGERHHTNVATVKSNECTDRLWLHCTTAIDCHDHCKCIKYNAVWFPQFHIYVRAVRVHANAVFGRPVSGVEQDHQLL